jgi:chromosome segregation ATPase
VAPTPKATPHVPIASSPTKEELNSLKSITLKAEQSFRSYTDLVRSISTEVEKLESAAKKAESEASAIGGAKSKSKMGFGKSKAKKEYESALQSAHAEREKVEEAKAKLAAAESEAEDAKREMERLRQKYEEMEMEAVTVQSYLSVQKEAYDNHQQAAKVGDYQPQNQYNDPFGMAPANPSSTSFEYGTSNSADNDYDNPFAI